MVHFLFKPKNCVISAVKLVGMKKDEKPVKVLFVCMGNICRSPSAEAVMNNYVAKAGLSEQIVCDSAGTIAYHAGESADARMQQHALKRGYRLTSISRQITPTDFREFDYVIAMDDENLRDLKPFIPNEKQTQKISKMTDYCSKRNPGFVPDPYYGGAAGFEQVLDILEDACDGLLKTICNEHKC
jgi:protein-tyrosine phosphatase